jgi:hypothetical protein
MKRLKITILSLLGIGLILLHSCDKENTDIASSPLTIGKLNDSIIIEKLNPSKILFGKLTIMRNDSIYLDSTTLDYDKDGVVDFRIGYYFEINDSGSYSETSGGIMTYYPFTIKKSWIQSFNETEINAELDRKFVYKHDSMEIIDNSIINWVTSGVKLTIAESGTGILIGYNEMENIDNPNTYIVFRKIKNNISKFGWIRINPKKSNGVEIFEFAYQK